MRRTEINDESHLSILIKVQFHLEISFVRLSIRTRNSHLPSMAHLPWRTQYHAACDYGRHATWVALCVRHSVYDCVHYGVQQDLHSISLEPALC